MTALRLTLAWAVLGSLLTWGAWGQEHGIRYEHSAGILERPDRFVWGQRDLSWVHLYPVEGKDHVAEVKFQNHYVHQNEVISFTLRIDGLAVVIVADVGQGSRPDFIDVEVPDGFIAVPPSISVAEEDAGRVLIYRRKTQPST